MSHPFRSMMYLMSAGATLLAFAAPVAAQYRLNVSPDCVFELHSSRGTVVVPACSGRCCGDPACFAITVELSLFPPSRALEFPAVVLVDREMGGSATESFTIRNISGVPNSLLLSLRARFKTSDGTVVGSDSVVVTARPGAMLDDLTFNPPTVIGGTLSEGTIHLQCAVNERDWPVEVASKHPAAQTVDDVVAVRAGQTNAAFLISTQPVLLPTDVVISATSRGVTVERTLRLIPGAVDLSVRKIEVTQGIQYLDDGFGHADNSLPLVGRRPTAVRVYLGSNTPLTINPIPVSLASRAPSDPPDAWVSHAPLWPFTKISAATTALEQRESPASEAELADRPWNATFLIDPTYITGSRIFRAEVNPDHLILEPNYANNVNQVGPITFRATRDFNVKFVRIDWCPNCPFSHNPQHKPNWNKIYPMLAYAKKMLPVDNINHWKANREVNITSLTPHNFRKDAAWGYTLTALAAMKEFTSDEADHMHYYGILSGNVPNGDTCGMAWLPPNPTVAMGVSTCGGGTFVHEIGHNLGRKHAPCPAPGKPGAPAGPDGNWPDASNPDTIIGHTGFDLDTHLALSGDEYSDLMSYCHPRWLSPYTYKQIADEFPVVAASQTPEPVAGMLSDHVVVRGVIDEEGVLFLPPIYRKMLPVGSHDEVGEGSHSIEMRAKDGRMLRSRRFTPELEDAVAGKAFIQIMPYEGETSQINFMVPGPKGEELAEASMVTSHAPTVQVLQPNGGESLGAAGGFTVRWTASDPDADAMFYMVLYSRDGGNTWESLALDLPEMLFEVELADVAGSDQGLFRIIASDGVHNAQDDSDGAFAVAPKAPEVAILGPTDRSLFSDSAGVLLRGIGTDPEDGPLADSALAWMSQRDGKLGTGADLATQLSPGVHVLTLMGLDSDGQMATSSISFAVGTIGDCDKDGYVTLLDYRNAQSCLSGPGDGLPNPDCSCADLDGEGHVDLFDLAYLQMTFTGPP